MIITRDRFSLDFGIHEPYFMLNTRVITEFIMVSSKLFRLILPVMLITACTGPVHQTTPDLQKQILNLAESYMGVPYIYGGTDRSGMDCSGLVCRIYNDLCDWNIPHSTRLLYQISIPVRLSRMRIGDLVFFGQSHRQPPAHVGIYTGNNHFVHSSASRGVIRSSLTDSYYKKRFLGIRRLTGSCSGQPTP